MNSESGQLPMHHAMKLITAISVLPERGGMLMIRRLVFPITTRSSASQIGLWWDAGIMSAPLRARNMVLVNVSRSARLSAISFGVIVLSAQRFQNGGAGISWSHTAIARAVINFLFVGVSMLGQHHLGYGRIEVVAQPAVNQCALLDFLHTC